MQNTVEKDLYLLQARGKSLNLVLVLLFTLVGLWYSNVNIMHLEHGKFTVSRSLHRRVFPLSSFFFFKFLFLFCSFSSYLAWSVIYLSPAHLCHVQRTWILKSLRLEQSCIHFARHSPVSFFIFSSNVYVSRDNFPREAGRFCHEQRERQARHVC